MKNIIAASILGASAIIAAVFYALATRYTCVTYHPANSAVECVAVVDRWTGAADRIIKGLASSKPDGLK